MKSAGPTRETPIEKPVLREMHRLGLPIVKMRLAAALQQGRDRVPVQSPGVLGAAPTCTQVVEWVSRKEAKKERQQWWLQIGRLFFAFIGAVAAVVALLHRS
jgi:hypothetical protein